MFKRWFAGDAPEIATHHWRAAFDASEALTCLDKSARKRLCDMAISFLREKRFEAAGGLDIDDGMRARIALEASLPVLELGLDWYRRASGVILYPTGFRVEQQWTDDDGVVHDREAEMIGEAWDGGAVILAWEDILEPAPGNNVVIHEFAHVLDALNGRINGFPPGLDTDAATAWTEAFSAGFADHCRCVENDEAVYVDDYAAEDESEFFAVVVETFFIWPENVAEGYPRIYDALRNFFRQDPLERMGRASESAH